MEDKEIINLYQERDERAIAASENYGYFFHFPPQGESCYETEPNDEAELSLFKDTTIITNFDTAIYYADGTLRHRCY